MIRTSTLIFAINFCIPLIANEPEISVPIIYHYSRGSNFPQETAIQYDLENNGPTFGKIKIPITKIFVDGLLQSNPGLVELALRKGVLHYISSELLEKIISNFISKAATHEKEQQETIGTILSSTALLSFMSWAHGNYQCASLIAGAGAILSALYYLKKSQSKYTDFRYANYKIIGYLLYYRVFDHPNHAGIQKELQSRLLQYHSKQFLRINLSSARSDIRCNEKLRAINANFQQSLQQRGITLQDGDLC